MNQLLPIIRRVRRPLVVCDQPPVTVGSVEPVEVNAECETRNAELGNIEAPRPAGAGAQHKTRKGTT